MKRLMILFALCLFPSLVSTPVYAVQLEQGRYIRWGNALLLGRDRATHSQWGVEWIPTSLIGSAGSLTISDGVYLYNGRTVTVTQPFDATTGILFEDAGRYERYSGNYYNDLYFEWETNYNGSELQMQILRQGLDGKRTLIWAQPLSGFQYGPTTITPSVNFVDGEQTIFSLVVVPEPPTWIALGFFATCLLLSQTCPRNLLSDKGSLPCIVG